MQTKIIRNPDGLDSIKLELPIGYEYRFKDNNTREAINELGVGFGLGCWYYFYQTTLNPKADKVIAENCQDFKRRSVTSWHFNANMMRLLLELIHNNSTRERMAHMYFPLVENVGVHDVDVHTEQVYWPVIHILKDATSEQRRNFVKSVEYVLQDRWDEIKNREFPYNYNMEAFKVLRDKRIQLLLIEEPTLFTGDELKKAIDWLLPYRYIYEPKTEWFAWDD